MGLSFQSASAGVDPQVRWATLHSEHFEVIYDRKYKEQALLFVKAGELAFSDLSKVFSETLKKTVVVILDQSDLANGFAQFLPYPTIILYPVLPASMDGLSYYDNWPLELMVHEYTHILSMQPSNSFYAPLRWIFGNVIRPNAILPRWWLEGVAVEMETRFTSRGRLRSPYTFAALRALAAGQNKFTQEDLARINEVNIPSFPFGSRPYLYGSLMWRQIIENKDLSVVDKLHQRYSRRLPFLLNPPLRDQTGLGYSQTLEQLYAKILEAADQQNHKIKTQSVDVSQAAVVDDSSQRSASMSPDGKRLVYISQNVHRGSYVKLLEKNGASSFLDAPSKTLFRGSGFNKLSWLPDSQSFVFDQLKTWRRHYNFRDLYLYDFNTKKIQRLTQGERASDPSVSPDGSQVVYVKTDGLQTELRLLDLTSKTKQSLYKPPLLNRVASPEFISGQEVIFAGRSTSGVERLYRLNLKSKRPEVILPEHQQVSQIKQTAKGLLFVSSKTGVDNVYLASKDLRQARALSNTHTRVVNADLDPQSFELWSARLTEEGTKLFVNKQPRTHSPPKVTPLLADLDGWNTSSRALPEVEVKEGSYWPIKYLFPSYWVPFVYPVDGGMLFQGSTGSQDPVGINSYLLDASYDTITENLSYGFAFTNRSFPLNLQLSWVEYQDYLGSSDLVLTHSSQSAGFSFFLPGLNEKFRGSTSYLLNETQTPNRDLKRQGGTASIAYSDFDEATSSSVYVGGNQVALNYVKFFEGEEQIAYDQYRLSLANRLSSIFPSRHYLLTQIKGMHAPLMNLQTDVIALGDKTVGGNYLASLINSSYLMRGYPSGAFVGRSLVNLNAEYVFPIADIYKGFGLFPLFLNSIQTALFVDGVGVDGAYYDINHESYVRSKMENHFWATGLEFRLGSTAAYHLPVSFTLGFYYGFYDKAAGGLTSFVGLGYTPYEGVKKARSQVGF